MGPYAEVIIDLITDATDKPFHYLVPQNLHEEVFPGRKVSVTFGRKKLSGYVLDLLAETEVSGIKEIQDVLDPAVTLNREFLELARWFHSRHYCHYMESINLLLPPGYGRIKEKWEKVYFLSPRLQESSAGAWSELARKAPRQCLVLKLLWETGRSYSGRELLAQTGAGSAVLREMVKKGLLKVKERPVSEPEEKKSPSFTREILNLSTAQQAALKAITSLMQKGKEESILLHGVTGSGKTEVYARAAGEALKQGKSAVILVPEIALTPQMISYFKERLPGEVALLHSQLPVRERYLNWFKIKEGRCRVVLGTRSAVFAPLQNIGLVVIDEEQENSYKQDESPRYHARDVAQWRASYHGAVLVLGSATPAIETYHRGLEKEISLLEMPDRATPYPLPGIEIVDMREEMKQGRRSIFSLSLKTAMEESLDKGEQILLFLNRRGFFNFVMCRECGFVVRCPHCSASLTFHSEKGTMICHYCDHFSRPPDICPGCKGVHIRYFGAGTQRVEDEVKKIFPGCSILRMDRDTTSRKGSHQRLWEDFKGRKAQVLIGTQMIAKGLDFPGVTLVGVVAADTSLHLPDFRSAERTFQLMTQVSGRAGRGERKGRVVVQTYHPGHYSIVCARDHDYRSFYREEIGRRRELLYPPFSQLLRMLLISETEEKGWQAALHLQYLLQGLAGRVELLGPAPAPMSRLKGHFRYHLILKGEELDQLSGTVKEAIRTFKKSPQSRQVRLTVDLNPLSML